MEEFPQALACIDPMDSLTCIDAMAGAQACSFEIDKADASEDYTTNTSNLEETVVV